MLATPQAAPAATIGRVLVPLRPAAIDHCPASMQSAVTVRIWPAWAALAAADRPSVSCIWKATSCCASVMQVIKSSATTKNGPVVPVSSFVVPTAGFCPCAVMGAGRTLKVVASERAVIADTTKKGATGLMCDTSEGTPEVATLQWRS